MLIDFGPLQAPQRPQYSMLRARQALPPQVHIMSLYDDGGTIIFRLVHIFEVTMQLLCAGCNCCGRCLSHDLRQVNEQPGHRRMTCATLPS
jgi:hypothetical protein